MEFIVKHKVLVAVAILLLVGAAWYGLSGSSTPAPDLTATPLDSKGPDQTLVTTLLTLRAVKLDGTIFSEPAYLSLQDFSTAIVPEPVGRPNPFAPLSSISPLSTTTRGAQLFKPHQ